MTDNKPKRQTKSKMTSVKGWNKLFFYFTTCGHIELFMFHRSGFLEGPLFFFGGGGCPPQNYIYLYCTHFTIFILSLSQSLISPSQASRAYRKPYRLLHIIVQEVYMFIMIIYQAKNLKVKKMYMHIQKLKYKIYWLSLFSLVPRKTPICILHCQELCKVFTRT